jgi:hypothetical protein
MIVRGDGAMRIDVQRIVSDDEATISTVFVDGGFVCFGLEDEFREDKVPAETRIPAGEYPVGIREVGGFHGRYSRKFPDIHRGMLEIKDVPGFEHVLIHVGNTNKDTAGCLLVGTGAMARDGDMSVMASVEAYRKFYPMVIDAAVAGDLSIRIVDSDRNGARLADRIPMTA